MATALALVTLLPTVGLAKEDYISIQELRKQSQSGWKQTYETKWRTVEIDAAIQIPDVDAVPIVRVGYYDAEPEEGWQEELDWGKRTVVTGIKGWAEVEYREDALILYNGWKDAPKSADGRRINQSQEARGVWHSDYDTSKRYIPMCDLTFGEFCTLLRQELSRFGFDPDQYEIENPKAMHTQHWYYYGYKEDALPGSLFYTATQKFCGLPYLAGIWSAVHDHVNGESRTDELDLYACGVDAGYDAYAQQLSHLYVDTTEVQETLAADVPLCSIDKVIKAVEPLIEQGHIRKVYEIKLGQYRTK